jgi:protein required for attachment to host cells
MRHHITWIVVADGARGRILVPTEDLRDYRTARSFDSAAAHAAAHELGAAKPGRVHESATRMRHTIEPRKDPHLAAKDAFAGEIAAALNDAAATRAFDRLILVALPHTAASLRAALDETAASKIFREIHRDLTKVSDHDLPAHLRAAEA